VLYVLDATEEPIPQVNTMLIGIVESQESPTLTLANKIDFEASGVQRVQESYPAHEVIPLSALEGDNMDTVYGCLAERFV
jgi:GTPase Era involved in 16S rRNA processing